VSTFVQSFSHTHPCSFLNSHTTTHPLPIKSANMRAIAMREDKSPRSERGLSAARLMASVRRLTEEVEKRGGGGPANNGEKDFHPNKKYECCPCRDLL
jgi:hypothetical protein